MNLLAVDLGVRTGLACWTSEGRLVWYRSQNYGSKNRLGKAVFAILRSVELPSLLVVEGGGRLAVPWTNAAERMGWGIEPLHAEEWRRHLINSSEWSHCNDLKTVSVHYAVKAAAWGGHPVAGELNHNAAEAILAGLWILIKRGYIENPPWPLPYTVRSK